MSAPHGDTEHSSVLWHDRTLTPSGQRQDTEHSRNNWGSTSNCCAVWRHRARCRDTARLSIETAHSMNLERGTLTQHRLRIEFRTRLATPKSVSCYGTTEHRNRVWIDFWTKNTRATHAPHGSSAPPGGTRRGDVSRNMGQATLTQYMLS